VGFARPGSGSLANNVGAVLAMTADIEMNMGPVIGIGIRSQDGRKPFAGCSMDSLQELPFLRRLAPIGLHGNLLSITQLKGRYVYRFSQRVLRKFSFRKIISAPALVSWSRA